LDLTCGSGETGSGKSENRKLILKFFTMLRAQSKKESRIFSQITAAQSIVESFSCAQTQRNGNASRMGLHTELQFNNRGRVIGCKLLDYHLEKTRVTDIPSGERNFHVFYQLMAGALADERQRWRLQDASAYAYLGASAAFRAPSTNDEMQFENLRACLKAVGLGKKPQSQIFRVLAAIIHLGNVQFADPPHSATSSQESAYVRNDEQLVNAADMLGVHSRALEGVLTYKQTLVKKDMVTLLLNSSQAGVQRDNLARSLYGLLWSWIIEQVNQKLCTDETQSSLIGIADLVGYQADFIRAGGHAMGFDQFIYNFGAERLHNFCMHQIFVEGNDDMVADGVQPPAIDYIDNATCLDMLLKPRTGLFAIMDKQLQSSSKPATDDSILMGFQRQHSDHPLFLQPTARLRSFAVQHYAGQCTYDVDGYAETSKDSLTADFVSLFRGNGADLPGSANAFVVSLFEGGSVVLEAHARNAGVLVAAQQKNAPVRGPSMRKPKVEVEDGNTSDTGDKKKGSKFKGTGTQVHTAIGEMIDSLTETQPWFILCVRPHEKAGAGFDLKYVRGQTRSLQLAEIAMRNQIEYTSSFTHQEFMEKFAVVFSSMSIDRSRDKRSQCEAVSVMLGFTTKDMCIGRQRVWVSDLAWTNLENGLRSFENDSRRRQKDGLPPMAFGDTMGMPKAPFMVSSRPGSVYSDDNQSYISDNEYGSYQRSAYGGSEVDDLERQHDEKLLEEEVEEKPEATSARKRWVCCTWSLTWWIPTPIITMCGVKRGDIQIAWREKVALCILIFFTSLLMLFFIAIFGRLVCPKQDVFTMFELQDGYSSKDSAYTAIRGEVFDITNMSAHHGVLFSEIMKTNLFAGKDATEQFPVQVSQLCDGADGQGIDFTISLQNYTKVNAEPASFHDWRWYKHPEMAVESPDRYTNLMRNLRLTMKKGYVGWDPAYLRQLAREKGRHMAIIGDQVFDFTDYNNRKIFALFPDGSTGDGGVNNRFMDEELAALFEQMKGEDITKEFTNLFKQKNDSGRKRRMQARDSRRI
jgi:chitin synthase